MASLGGLPGVSHTARSIAQAACSLGGVAFQTRCASSASSRWKSRQGSDPYAREAKLKGMKSRAAFKLIEMDSKYRLFKKGQTVVDLGFAPGSWSQVALERTQPNSHVLGIDILPAQPPRGVHAVQGNFLSPAVQTIVRETLREAHTRKASLPAECAGEEGIGEGGDAVPEEGGGGEIVVTMSHPDMEKRQVKAVNEEGQDDGRVVDLVLSDMMMNTSGMAFRDHAGSMDLCFAALRFASDTLKPGGHFVCKFYAGAEDKKLEGSLRKMFGRVQREKPDSSRKESREQYFVAMRRKKSAIYEQS